MSFDKQIHDKFSGFEPEVPDEHVNAGWEKIRYFLPPEEKKKRGFFFYRRKGQGIVATVFVVIALFIGFLFMRNWVNTSTQVALQRISPAPRLAKLNSIATHDAAFVQGTEKSPDPKGTPAEGSAVGTRRKSYLPLTPHLVGSLPAIHQNTQRSASANASENTAFLNHAKPDTSVSLANTTAAPGNHAASGTSYVIPYLQPHSSASTEFMMLLKQASLAPEVPFAPGPEPVLLHLERLDSVLPNKRRPSLELFAGFNSGSLQLKAGPDKKTVQANGFSAGMAVIFPIKSKFYLSGQFIVCYHPVKYYEEREANVIIKRDVVPSVSSSTINHKDTLIYYIPYTSTFKLESNSTFHLSGGVGYRLFNRGRLSMDGALLLNIGWMRVSYRTSRVNSDTGIFVNTILTSNAAAASFYESVEKSSGPESVSKKASILSFGVNPCLNLAYQLNRNTALLFRPAYMMQFSPNTVEANGKSYRLKENNWFIYLGLRRTF